MFHFQERGTSMFRKPLLLLLMLLVGEGQSAGLAWGQAPRPKRCVVAELFVSTDSPLGQKAQADLEKRTGLQLRVLNVTTDKDALRRFYALVDKHKVKAGLPMLHVCRQVALGYDQPATTGVRYDNLLTVEVYVRAGCPHCAAAKAFVQRIEGHYPGLKFVFYDVVAHEASRQRYEAMNRAQGIRVPGLPTFNICGEAIVGYSDDATSGARVQKILDEVTVRCEPAAPQKTKPQQQQQQQQPPQEQGSRRVPAPMEARRTLVTSSVTSFLPWPRLVAAQVPPQADLEVPPERPKTSPPPATAGQGGDVVEDITAPPPRPDDLPANGSGPSTTDASATSEEQNQVEVPLFGKLNVKQLGMPLFTIIIGLIDGFNPCAMWVLLFLLSILVPLQDRRKIILVAGTFVLISGLAYFAFMAAWLNVFRLIGYRRWSEVVLGLIAVAIGLIHIKDFFAFKRGITLSIPESAKPGIYARVRRIVTAENLTAAVVGAAGLAVLINMVELLCTAGLPALYTKVLTMQGYPTWVEYAYLALYNGAYMFDDSIMVGIAVFTLGRHKLQEREGRWLKLLSGLAILVLGLILLLVPQWLL